jgi:hypothetical protein
MHSPSAVASVVSVIATVASVVKRLVVSLRRNCLFVGGVLLLAFAHRVKVVAEPRTRTPTQQVRLRDLEVGLRATHERHGLEGGGLSQVAPGRSLAPQRHAQTQVLHGVLRKIERRRLGCHGPCWPGRDRHRPLRFVELIVRHLQRALQQAARHAESLKTATAT